MPLKGALVGWQGSSSIVGGDGRRNVSLTKYPENWLENIYWAGVRYRKRSIPSIDRRDIVVPGGSLNTGVPVGPGVVKNMPIVTKVPSVPTVRQPVATKIVAVSPKINGIKKAPGPYPVPTIKPALPKLPPQILNPPVIQTPQPRGPLDVLIDLIKPNKPTKVQPVGLDLGSLLTTGINAYRDIRVSNVAAQPVYDMQGLNPFSEVPLNQYDMAAPGQAGPGTCLAPGYKYDKCGNIVKTRRRRRRRLATGSDIKDLAALSSVTTPAEKKTWIATHPS